MIASRCLLLTALASWLGFSQAFFTGPSLSVNAPSALRREEVIPRSLWGTADDIGTGENPPKPFPSIASVASTKDSAIRSSPKLTKTPSDRWEPFDYLRQWYPVSWDVDLVTDRPTKVTLFDVDYVIARNGQGIHTALEDRCPHKAASLSEGRLTESGLFQCAYHGWSFNGTNGDCVQIPQAPPGAAAKRACAKAIPIVEHQQMIWLWPGPDRPTVLPPTIPEMDLPGWKVTKVVRDFPDVDWPLLVSNIMDPDHGCFAHTALPFDMYSANAEHPLKVQEHWERGEVGWGFSSTVLAVDKILQVDRDKRTALGLKPRKGKTQPQRRENQTQAIQATSRWWAPTTVTQCRRDERGETKFMTAFWVTPVGTGKSRFMSAAISSVPLHIPRWIFHININRFLDQDTILVATQQPHLLRAEAEGVEKPRSFLFTYGSPTDATVRLIDRFWDSTLHKVPNRQRILQQLYQAGKLNHTPSREVVLDRNVQHLKICPDSQGFVRNCELITRASLAVTAVCVTRTLWARALPKFPWLPILSTFVAWVADQLRRQFYFCKTEASRNKDLKLIPVKAWLDP